VLQQVEEENTDLVSEQACSSSHDRKYLFIFFAFTASLDPSDGAEAVGRGDGGNCCCRETSDLTRIGTRVAVGSRIGTHGSAFWKSGGWTSAAELDVQAQHELVCKDATGGIVSMLGSESTLGPELGEYGEELPREGARQRGQRMAAVATSRSRKRSTRKRGGVSAPIAGIGHRRQRKWSW